MRALVCAMAVVARVFLVFVVAALKHTTAKGSTVAVFLAQMREIMSDKLETHFLEAF